MNFGPLWSLNTFNPTSQQCVLTPEVMPQHPLSQHLHCCLNTRHVSAIRVLTLPYCSSRTLHSYMSSFTAFCTLSTC